MANLALTQTQKYTMDDAGQSPTKPIVGEYYNYDANAYYNFNQCDIHLNWDNACAYFITALIFGMVDSMCKNMTMRLSLFVSPLYLYIAQNTNLHKKRRTRKIIKTNQSFGRSD
jgi:hypothetical protein